MVIVQITFQQGCELQKHPQKHNVQDMIKILCNVENVQCLILGKRVAQLLCIRKRLVLFFKHSLYSGKGRVTDDANNNSCIQCAFRHERWIDLTDWTFFESQNGFADIVRFTRCCCCYYSQINVQLITISVFESNNSPRKKEMLWHTVEFSRDIFEE